MHRHEGLLLLGTGTQHGVEVGWGVAVETVLGLHPFSSSVLWGCSVKRLLGFHLRVEWFEWVKGLGPGP